MALGWIGFTTQRLDGGALFWVTLVGQQIVRLLTLMFGTSAINAFCGDRERAIFSPSDPALFS
jgi:hypothetical protein